MAHPAPRAPEAPVLEPPSTPAPPSAPFTETKEFRDAVAATVREALKDFKASPETSAVDTGSVLRELAMEIAKMNDVNAPQGAPVRVPPDILARREAAREKMIDRLVQVRDQKLEPRYKAISKLYLNERVIEPFKMGPNKKFVQVEFMWQGEPSGGMRPANELATELYDLWQECHTGGGKVVKGDKRYYTTKSGPVVEGDPPSSSRTMRAESAFGEDLRIIEGAVDPEAQYINVLGTIAPPAMQNYEGKTA